MKGSIVIPCLDSHEVVRRQLLWISSWMAPFADRWNLVLVDDGSNPKISITPPTSHETILYRIPSHPEKWTQPRARNVGARACPASQLIFFTDIDHILTPEALADADSFRGDMLRFHRKPAFLDPSGKLHTKEDDLLNCGFSHSDLKCKSTEHKATFAIRKTIHDLLGGFDEKFCGTYGSDDIDYSQRYEKMRTEGNCKPSEFSASPIYVFPNPRDDRLSLFHRLLRTPQ